MKSKAGLVSVIVPLSKGRLDFFHGYTLPSIKANNPLEIIIIDEEGKAPYKRNKGAAQATGKYIFFCDDDVILKSDCLHTLVEALEENQKASFAYCNFVVINLTTEIKPAFKNVLYSGTAWDPVLLREFNYIDTGSLILRKDFLGFDEEMPRYQDWEMWLRMAKAGKEGFFVNKVLFFSFKFDRGIGISVPHEEAVRMIDRKHPKSEWPFKNLDRYI